MPPPIKSTKHVREEIDSPPSSNLWVGNLTSDTTDAEVMEVFSEFGALDCVLANSPRNYGFVFFMKIEEAEVAKDRLQGTSIRGSSIKIEFAKPAIRVLMNPWLSVPRLFEAKPCRQLWVGGLSPSVTKEKLEEHFNKYGKIEELKFFREKNSAVIEFVKLEDASQALRNMNAKHIGGQQIRVDFVRSLSSRRLQEHWPDLRDGQLFARGMGPSEPRWMSQEPFLDPTQTYSPSLGVRKGDGQPTKVLWIGYPPSVQIDEHMIHNAMILFGEIERIKNFPSRHYAFVEFRSVDEAQRCKEGLQGRLFNDPRITIMFSNSDFAPGKEFPELGSKGPGADVSYDDQVFFGHNRPIVPVPSRGILGSGMPMKSFGPQGSYEPLLPGPEGDVATIRDLSEASPRNLAGANWRKSSPSGAGLLPSPLPGVRPSVRHVSGGWDVFDAKLYEREAKRSRLETFPIDDVSGGRDMRTGRLSGFNQAVVEGSQPDSDYTWRGFIAKGGTPVCRARCVPIGRGLHGELPDVVNCSARTGLEMLTKHYSEAIGFDIVFFLPDSEEDFASYTEFLRYLGARNRAGVAKLDDGTTLFLVPPSEFLTKVLNVAGPERLYGVVLNFPEAPSRGGVDQLHPPAPVMYNDRQQMPPLPMGHNQLPKEERILQMDYGKDMLKDSKVTPRPVFPPSDSQWGKQSVQSDYTSNIETPVPQAGVSLTPELIATLANFLPGKTQSVSESGQQYHGSNLTPSFPSSDPGTMQQGWKQDIPSDQINYVPQHSGNQFVPQAKGKMPPQTYPNASNALTHLPSLGPSGAQLQDHSFNPSQGTMSSRPFPTYAMSSQSGQYQAPQQANQQYEPEVIHNVQNNYGFAHGKDGPGFYGTPDFQQYKTSANLSSQIPVPNYSQPQAVAPLPTDRTNLTQQNPQQQLQPLAGVGQGSSEVEADKNQRYQSTLQFAASLLLQIQQQQQAGQGTGNHQ